MADTETQEATELLPVESKEGLEPFELEIFNFQSIRHAKVSLAGFTTIQGPTDVGKSAILRAVRTVLFNDWHPGWQRDESGETQVHMTIPRYVSSEVSKVIVFKSDKRNEYRVEYRDGSPPKAYPKIGRDTPQELKDMGFAVLTTERGDTHNLNVQKQLQNLFLITEGGPALVSFMNVVFKVAKYEKANKTVNADMQAHVQKTNLLRDQATRTRDQYTQSKQEAVAAAEAVVKQDTLLKHLSPLIDKSDFLSEHIALLSSLSDQVFDADNLVVECQARHELTATVYSKVKQIGEFSSILNPLLKVGEELQQTESGLKFSLQALPLLNSVKQVAENLHSVSTLGSALYESGAKEAEVEQELEARTVATTFLPMYLDVGRKILSIQQVGSALNLSFSSVANQEQALSSAESVLEDLASYREPLALALPIVIRRGQLEAEIQTLQSAISQENSASQQYAAASEGIQTLDQAKETLLSVVSVCPTCKQSMEEQHVH